MSRGPSAASAAEKAARRAPQGSPAGGLAGVEEARRAAHELNNQLTLVIGYGELLEDLVEGEAAELVKLLLGGARHGVQNLRRVQTQLHALGAQPTAH